MNRSNIFFNRGNYFYCIDLLNKYATSYSIRIVVYCLMPNHYHLILKQESDESIAKYMGVVFNAYVQAVNRQMDRSGTLFEGRFRHVHIDRDEYILHLCRYIHLNPVKSGMVGNPEDWEFSDYKDWIFGRRNRDIISTYFLSPREYAKFVLELKEEQELKPIKPFLLDE